jgi:hypothetical protein
MRPCVGQRPLALRLGDFGLLMFSEERKSLYAVPAQMPSAIKLGGELGRDSEVARSANPSAALFFSLDFGHIVPGEAAHRSLAALNYLEIAKAEKVAHGHRFH